MPLIILDRDGVINFDSDNYIRSLEEWVPIPGSIEAIARLSAAGFTVTVATNQSGLARGYFEIKDLEAIHASLCRQVEDLGGQIAGIFYCPHLPGEGCNCRKPATGLLESIERELKLPARDAFFIGDSLKDLQAAQSFGCKPILVRTGKGVGTLEILRSAEPRVEQPLNIPVYADLADASHHLLKTKML